MLVISHRGSNRKAPENSMEAMALSIDEGAMRVELDLWLSADKKVFVSHDDFLGRKTSSNTKISNSSSSELSNVFLENGEKLPSLEDVLSLLERAELNLELKGVNHQLVEETAKTIKQHPLRDKIILSSFNTDMLKLASEVCPEIRRAYLWEKEKGISIKDQIETIRENLTKTKTNIFHPEARAYNDELDKFRWFNDLQVFTWSELRDEEIRENSALWERLYQFKVDGHCTNFPLELAYFLRQKTLQR